MCCNCYERADHMFDDIQKMRPVDVMPDTTGFVQVIADVDSQPKFPEDNEGEMPEDD